MTVFRSLRSCLHFLFTQGLMLVLIAVLLVAQGSMPAIAWAQSLPQAVPEVELPTEPSRPNYLSPDSNDIPSEKVNQFVQAFLQVLELIERREGELQGAETESESLRIQREIETEALAIIAAAGLTKTEYLQLLGLANTDSEFGERIAAQLQEANS